MNRSRLIKGISLCVILVSIGFFFLIYKESSRHSIESTQHKQKRHNKLWVRGLIYKSFKGR